jgi:O-antigen/teichoic acid export membrane protein
MNWLALVAGMAVTFLLSPIVVHRLGNTTYGVWSLIVATISYLSLLDMGLRGAITRYVSRDIGRGDFKAAEMTIAAGFALRLATAVIIIISSVILAFIIPMALHIPRELHRDTTIALMISGCTLAVQMLGGVFGAILAAEHRFDLISWTTIAQTLLRAGSVVTVLRAGKGIVAVALCELGAVVIASLLLWRASHRQLPQVKLRLRRPETSMIKEMWQFSATVFLINSCQQVIYYTDNFVVGVTISAAAVTFYTIGGSLIEYLRQIVSSLTTTLMPLASRYDATGEKGQIQALLIRGSQASMVIALPVAVTLMVRGGEFIGLWMGPEYAKISGAVLQILLVSTIFVTANAAGGNVLYGTSQHGQWSKYVTFQAVLNLITSVGLGLRYGILGVAVGTVIPALIVNIWLMPRYLAKVTNVKLTTYIWQGWMRPTLAVIPFAVVTALVAHRWPARNLAVYFVQIIGCLPVYALTVALVFFREVRDVVLEGRAKRNPAFV